MKRLSDNIYRARKVRAFEIFSYEAHIEDESSLTEVSVRLDLSYATILKWRREWHKEKGGEGKSSPPYLK